MRGPLQEGDSGFPWGSCIRGGCGCFSACGYTWFSTRGGRWWVFFYGCIWLERKGERKGVGKGVGVGEGDKEAWVVILFKTEFWGRMGVCSAFVFSRYLRGF